VPPSILFHAALALALGMLAQTLASRLRVPGILLLLILGVVVGPSVLGWFDPSALRAARTELVTLAVTVILFEGGLGLRWHDLRQQQRSLIRLLTVGGAVSMAAGTLAAHTLLEMPWSTASLYGALMIVTGPTVVTPLLSRLRMDRTVRELLIGEGVLIDPLGAITALVVAEYVLGQAAATQAAGLVLARLGVGAVLGALAAWAMTVALQRRWIADDLRNPTVLVSVILVAAIASRLSSEAGLMSAVTQGVVMANTGLRSLGPLRQFKEEMTVLLLSFIFILLAADLSPQAVFALGANGLLVVGALIWVGRPLAVLLCTWGSDLSTRQRLFIAWICPRGVVAASVAGLFKLLLDDAGLPGGTELQALVFLTVACTVALQGLTAPWIARLLALDRPTLRGVVIVGADHFGRLLAQLLGQRDRSVVLIDNSEALCREATAAGLVAYRGDALSVDCLEEAGARYADSVFAVTRNVELNTLVAQRVRSEFRVENVFRVGTTRALSSPFPGDFPGIDEVNQSLRRGNGRIVTYQVPAGTVKTTTLASLPFQPGEFAVLLEHGEALSVAAPTQTLMPGDLLICVRCDTGDQSPLAAVLNEVAAASG